MRRRRCQGVARARGVPVVGSLGVLLRAKQLGLIAEVRPIVAHMERLGMYVSRRLLRVILDAAGESDHAISEE